MHAPIAITPTDVIISADLMEASRRSDKFPADWTEAQREASYERYRRFLRLKRLHPRARLAPTADIDEFWHLHMLSPVAYFNDCMRMFGRILDHDGGFGKGPDELPLLKQVFLETEAKWAALYGEPYRLDGRWAHELEATNCWHDCQDRCWHACADLEGACR